jgi:hypothetical protein
MRHDTQALLLLEATPLSPLLLLVQEILMFPTFDIPSYRAYMCHEQKPQKYPAQYTMISKSRLTYVRSRRSWSEA